MSAETDSDRYAVATVDQLQEDGDRVLAEVQGVELAVFRVESEYHAIANFCTHQGGPMCEGPVSGRTVVGEDDWAWDFDDTEKYVRCPWHGWMFDVTDGTNVDAEGYAVPSYDTEVTDGTVYIVV